MFSHEKFLDLYIIISSWHKHYLYDPAIKFESFSQFEVSVLLRIFIERMERMEREGKLKNLRELQVGEILIEYFKYLMFEINMEDNIVDESIIEILDRGEGEVPKSYWNSFYRLENKKKVPLYMRRLARDYYEGLAIFDSVVKCLKSIKNKINIFDWKSFNLN